MKRLARNIWRRLLFQQKLNGLLRRLRTIGVPPAPLLIDLPPGSRLLVLAPHPDDESIGCGGTLAKWRQTGRPARVLFLTDGRLGSRDLRRMPVDDPGYRAAQLALIATRQREARLALETLGVDEFAFADIPDGELSSHTALAEKVIQATIDDFQPDLIMLPFLTDRHPDHVAAGLCLLAVLRRMERRQLALLSCAGYEVWSPIQANNIVDITACLDQKQSAIAVYESQLRDTNYLDGTLSLSRYRAISNLIAGSHAEAFYIAPAEAYLALAV